MYLFVHELLVYGGPHSCLRQYAQNVSPRAQSLISTLQHHFPGPPWSDATRHQSGVQCVDVLGLCKLETAGGGGDGGGGDGGGGGGGAAPWKRLFGFKANDLELVFASHDPLRPSLIP